MVDLKYQKALLKISKRKWDHWKRLRKLRKMIKDMQILLTQMPYATLSLLDGIEALRDVIDQEIFLYQSARNILRKNILYTP